MFRYYSKQEIHNRVSIVGEHTEGMLKIAVARCSNQDQFNRRKGRLMAEGRLAKGKTYTEVQIDDCDIKTFVNIAKEIEQEVIAKRWYNLKN